MQAAVFPACLADFVNVRRVGMAQRRCQSRLLHEPSHSIGIGGNFGQQHLESYIAMQLGILGKKHFAHSAGAQPLENAVVIQQGPRIDLHHSAFLHGTTISARNRLLLDSAVKCATSPKRVASRLRTLRSPSPLRRGAGDSGSKPFSTLTSSNPSFTRPSTLMVPPSTSVAMPCFTAFSISGCSTSGD